MAQTNGTQSAILANGDLAEVSFVGPRVRVFNEQVAYASQASGDTIVVGTLPSGAVPLFIVLNTDTSTGTATLEFGDGTTAGKFAAAAAHTTTDTPTLIGLQAPGAAALSGVTKVIATVGTAALPSSGNLSVMIFYTLD